MDEDPKDAIIRELGVTIANQAIVIAQLQVALRAATQPVQGTSGTDGDGVLR